MEMQTKNLNVKFEDKEDHRCALTVLKGDKIVANVEFSVDVVKYHNICVYEISMHTRILEKEPVFKELFGQLAHAEQLPIYFKLENLSEAEAQWLYEIGATDFIDDEEITMWWAEKGKTLLKLDYTEVA